MATQTATIVVTDLAHSTDTRVELGEERADELRRSHDRLLSEVVVTAGGTVIKGLGDGLLVSFAGAAEAVGAAVTLQQAIETLGRRERLDLAIRVGVSSGDVAFEAGDSFGTPVVEASRLCDAARPGQILIADVVRVLARGRGGHDVTPVGVLELKGLPDSVEVYEVRWEPVRTPGDLRARSPYVGRVSERRTLVGRFEAAAGGAGDLVLVTGEPGIGKTRLVEEVCAEVAGDGNVTVLVGGCHDGDVVAYAPFVEALSAWVRRTSVETVARLLGAEAPVVGRIVPAIKATLPEVGEPIPVPAEEATARLHDAVRLVFERLAEESPVVLVLDDLHWADESTVGLTRAVARQARLSRMLVVATYRDTDLDRRHPLAKALPLLRREVEPTRIALDGLVLDDVRSMLEQLADHEVTEPFVQLLTRQTDGNPFFIREMLLHLTESGLLRFEGGRWVADDDIGLAIPEGVREVVGKRLSQLSDAANSLLTVGSLFEVAFPLSVAASVAKLEEDEALDAVDEALAARVVQPSAVFDHYAFTHALFRQTLQEELNLSRQVRLHRAIAEGLEKALGAEPSPDEAASLARHWQLSAALPGSERGVPYALAVARHAIDRYAPREAYDAYATALELLPEGDERELPVRLDKTEAALLAGIPEPEIVAEARELGHLAAATHGEAAAADALARVTRFAIPLGDHGCTWTLASEGRQWLDPNRRDSTWLVLRTLELDEADFHDPDQPGIPLDSPARRQVHDIFEHLDPADRPGLPMAPSSREVALRFVEDGRRANIEIIGLWYAMWSAGEFRALADEYHNDLAKVREVGSSQSEAFMLAVLSRTFAVLGLHEEADEALARGFGLLDRIPDNTNPAFQLFAAQQALAYIRGVKVGATDLSLLGEMADRPSTRWAALAIEAANAAAFARHGSVEEALHSLERILIGIARAPGWAPNYPFVVAEAASSLFSLNRADHAEIIEANLREKVLEPDLRYDLVDSRVAMAQLCSVTGRAGEASFWFDEAERVLTEEGCGPLLVSLNHDRALTHLRLGHDGDSEQFRAALASARSGCQHPAMVPWLERLDTLEAEAATHPIGPIGLR